MHVEVIASQSSVVFLRHSEYVSSLMKPAAQSQLMIVYFEHA